MLTKIWENSSEILLQYYKNVITFFLFECFKMSFIFVMAKQIYLSFLLQYLVTQNAHSEVILICWFYHQVTFIINVKNCLIFVRTFLGLPLLSLLINLKSSCEI